MCGPGRTSGHLGRASAVPPQATGAEAEAWSHHGPRGTELSRAEWAWNSGLVGTNAPVPFRNKKLTQSLEFWKQSNI